MDQVRPHMREQRFADCASLDWPTGPHPTLSGSGPAPTADRSKTPVAGLAREGLTPQGPLQADTGLDFHQLMGCIKLDNLAGSFHGGDELRPSTRAAVVLSAVGCDWRQGGPGSPG